MARRQRRRPEDARSAPRSGSCGVCWRSSPKPARPTSPAPSTTSSSPFATTCFPATRPARESTRSCSANSSWSSRPSPPPAGRLAESLRSHEQEALLYRRLATLRQDVPLLENLADLEWRGARNDLRELCAAWGESSLPNRILRWQDA